MCSSDLQGEPDKRERVKNWMAAIGLQDVDDLKPSQYFLDTVKQNIEGKITLEEVRHLSINTILRRRGFSKKNSKKGTVFIIKPL